MNTFGNNVSDRKAVIHSLAIAGFIALVGAGIGLAIFSTRYVPTVVGRIGTAAVYLGSVFTPAPEPSLSVIPTASTTIPFGDATTTEPIATSIPVTLPEAPSKTVAPTAGKETNSTHPIGGATTTPVVTSSLPDLSVQITAVGYLTTTSASSFVASSTVPAGFRPAVSFTIKNIGAGATGLWGFSASIPTSSNSLQMFPEQQSLKSGEYIDYTLGFDQAIAGTDKLVTITANFDRSISESNLANDIASTTITILGS